jgi:putative Mg2+ transporter-C (MgtC) family protein
MKREENHVFFVKRSLPTGGAMATWWHGVVEDFSDLPGLSELLRVVERLGVAVCLGGLLGFERERTGKQAGLRTHMLVSLGAALFVLVPQLAGMRLGDLSRVIQGLITGIGFVGAGTILKRGGDAHVKGLTTATSIWVAAAVGVAAGMGRVLTALVGTLLALGILSALRQVERWLSDSQTTAEEQNGGAPSHGGGSRCDT